jgi:hypothetical protein
MGKDGHELFRAYLDESEEHTAGLYVVGGFVAKGVEWDSIQKAWLRCLPERISCFHATDCFSGNNEFEPVYIDIPQRVALLDKLTDILVAHNVHLVGYGIDRRSYENVAPRKKQNEFLGNKYAAPLGGVIELACKAMGNLPTPTSIWKILDDGETWEQCSFFLEQNEYSKSAAKVFESMRVCRELWFRNRIGGDKYGPKTGADAIPLLQVADLGAFLVSRHRGNAAEGRISWRPYYDKLMRAGRIFPSVVADDYSVKALHKLHEELKKEAAEGKHNLDDI